MIKNKILGILNIELSKEWHPTKNNTLTPFDVTTGSGKKVWWKCEHGHEWQAAIYSRDNGRGCSKCYNTGNKKKKLALERSLAYKNSVLANEWGFVKNKPLTPSDVGEYSRKLVWWKCERGHEWEDRVGARTNSFKRGLGCPFCDKRKLSDEYSLAVNNPKLSLEWHPIKNNKLTAADFPPFSHEIVWWQCEKGHEWQSKISNRTSNRNCPYCANRKIDIHNENSLAKQNPTLASEWHPTKNGNLTAKNVPEFSSKIVWWQCEKRHEWKAKIANRSNKNGCPYCIGKKVCNDNCLEVKNPNLSKEWHPNKNGSLTPSLVVPGSNKKVWWACIYGHEWQAQVNSRSRGNGCPKCNFSNSYPEQFLFYSLSYLYKDIVQRFKVNKKFEVDIYIPRQNIAIEYDGSYWHEKEKKVELDIKKNKYLYDNQIRLIRIRENGLEFLENNNAENIRINENPTDIELLNVVRTLITIFDKRNLNKFNEIISDETNLISIKNKSRELMTSKNPINSLLAVFPHLAQEWNYQKNGLLNPENILPQSNIKVWWKCEDGHEWQTTPSERTRKGTGTNCPFCSGRYATEEFSLGTLYPRISEEWHPSKNEEITPYDVRPKSDKVVWWKCKNDHEWKEQIKVRHIRRGCPYCTGRYPSEKNSLASLNPQLAKEWHFLKNGELTPQLVRCSSTNKVWWVCGENHEWREAVNSRNRGSKCPKCFKS